MQSLICSFAHRSFPLFSKERLSKGPSFPRFVAILKKAKKCVCSFALLQRETKRAIAHSLFLKEQK